MFRGLITYLPAPITYTGAVLLRLPTLAEVFLWGERTALACHPRVTLCGRQADPDRCPKRSMPTPLRIVSWLLV